MSSDSLKRKAVTGVIWSSFERFSVQAIQFILSIILARLLAPSDYGIIGMINIFLAISQSIIDSGFSNALIQKKDRTQIDYSTVFFFNIAIGLFLYFILFLCADFIAKFYNLPILVPITRVIAINLFVNSLVIVQKAKLSIELNFKIQAKINTVSTLISGVIGLLLAYKDWGVWSLVYQSVLFNLLSLVLYWYYAKWRPSLVFSWSSFNQLFKYGSKLLITGLYGPIFDNINSLIIGKLYTPASLGYYNRADSLAKFPSSNITDIINRVTFPLLSLIQDDDDKLRHYYKKLITISAYIVFPLMIGLASISKPLISILLTEKWLPSAEYLELISYSLLWYPICAFNINLLLVKGAVQIHLKLDLLKKLLYLITLIITSNISIKAICIGFLISSLTSWIITALYSGKLIKLGLKQQIIDISPILLMSIISCLPNRYINSLTLSPILTIVIDLIISIILYITLSYIIKRELLFTIISVKNKNKQQL